MDTTPTAKREQLYLVRVFAGKTDRSQQIFVGTVDARQRDYLVANNATTRVWAV